MQKALNPKGLCSCNHSKGTWQIKETKQGLAELAAGQETSRENPGAADALFQQVLLILHVGI